MYEFCRRESAMPYEIVSLAQRIHHCLCSGFETLRALGFSVSTDLENKFFAIVKQQENDKRSEI